MQYGIDHLVTRSNLIFGYGWAFAPDQATVKLSLEVGLSDGTTTNIAIDHNRPRNDVRALFPDHPGAALAGFLLHGAVEASLRVSTAGLCVESADGALTRLEAPLTNLDAPPWSDLRIDAQATARVVDLIERVCCAAQRAGVHLIIDHALGGGANTYRGRLIEELLTCGEVVVLVTYNLPTLEHVLEIRSPNDFDLCFRLSSLAIIDEIASRLLIARMLFNNAVSHPDAEEIPELLASVAARGVPLTVAIHDFFSLCPSQYLLNSEGVYCDLPDVAVCRDCLPRNRFVFFGPTDALRIETWRTNWSRTLCYATEILCFSESSSALLRRVFPDVPHGRILIRPHSINLPWLPLNPCPSRPLHIGVVGTIDFHKGSSVIRSLAQRIKARQLDAKITVIGTLAEPADPDVISVTGAYEHAELPDMLLRSGINLILFPSIWPETFSYVTHELIRIRLPIVCFDLGAPAESVAAYTLGKVIPMGSADAILDHIVDFHDHLNNLSNQDVFTNEG